MSKAGKKSSKSSSPTSSDNKKPPVPIYRYKNVNFNNVLVSELERKPKAQPLCYLNYKDEKHGDTKLLVQSDKLKITDHGIPGIHEQYYPDDSKREFIKVPLDNGQDACRKLRKHFEEADQFFGSNKLRKKIFGNNADQYQYQPIIRTPQEQNNDEKKNKSGEDKPKHDFVKLKFNMAGSGESRVNRTKLFQIKSEKEKEPINADTITEVANHIRFQSEIKFIFYYVKIWANSSKTQGLNKYLYGVGLKVMAIEFVPNKGKGIDIDNLEFDESDDDDENEDNVSPKKSKSKLDDDDDDDDNGNDNNENGDENEEDEEPEEKQDKKSSKKKVVEEDAEEEEEQPKSKKKDDKKSKKPVKKSSKKVESEEEEEEEEEEEVKPKKRSSKNKSPSKSK
ncbi:hypothetical protein H012_gp625 [Acanthamoeba polyphaga moumouvirus]|uniref:Uncharacterized protein n=1 Tax=Acanthamoeba polyphaga moumouvirus TaxID=1269028 RepID=L7RCS2_9VIRU|nr:hypothetical protein H012_gp625 [Acanthamoeba polyphaga moumouvirus]AGC01838.1 hypothetical protein Moumou_00298 [Acanthamoeba polyphaga moumouvirus]AQN68194.1 hypothetical protein [Saudi moumouvirus]